MFFIHKFQRYKCSSAQLLAVCAFFIVTVFNYPFLSYVFDAIKPSSITECLFFLSVPVVLFCLTVVLLSVSGALFFPKIIIGLSVFISSLLFYATSVYGIIFDRSMIQNIVETNSGEAFSYLNISFVVFFVLLGLLPIVALLNQDLKEGFYGKFKSLIKLNVLSIAISVLLVGVFYKDFASVGRNHQNVTKYIVPFAFYDSGFKYLRDNYFYPPLPYSILDKQPELTKTASENTQTLVVVVGETARASNFSLNGYARDTNSLLIQSGVKSFSNVSSCGTATAVSVPCMFSRLNRENYASRLATSQDNVLDIIHRAGVDVTWIDNNSSCKGVCERINTIDYDPTRDDLLCDGDYCYDEILLQQLRQQLSQPPKPQSTDISQHKVIVLHMFGSHGPTYFRRYPDRFKKFLPDCPQSDIQHCSQAQLVNTYDNTIVYTDYVLSQIIAILNEDRADNKAMFYISDHGESLGEKGLYLHGFPYSLAPEEQTHVAMLYWDNLLQNPEHNSCVTKQLDRPLSHDNVFDTLLGLVGVNTKVYQADMDIFAQCHAFKSGS